MIKEIIPAITPDNIKDIQLLKDALDIFLDYLVKHSDITIDIKNILDEQKEILYEEFVKIYLNNIYNVLTKSQHNEALYLKLKTLYTAFGLDVNEVDLSIDIVSLLTRDYIMTNKDYKSAKGTPKAMEYIYDVIIESGVQKDFLGNNTGDFRYYEGEHIFEYNVEGTMLTEVYEHFVRPLTHPVGWAYFYKRLFYMSFVDYFRVDFEYTIRELEVRCMNGSLFEKDDYLANISHFKKRFDDDPNYGDILTAKRDDLVQENNTLDPESEKYKSNERLIAVYNKSLNGDFTLVSDNEVTFINTEIIGPADGNTKRISVHFKNGEVLQSLDTPREIVLYGIDGRKEIDYKLDYDGNCGLYMDYDVETKTEVTDEIDFGFEMPLASTTGKHNVIGAGNVFVGSFIVGDELVNKDVSVTYRAVTGKIDGTNYSRIYTPGGDDECPLYWDDAGVIFDDVLYFDGCKRFFDRYKSIGAIWDAGYNFDNFVYDHHVYTEDELRLLNPVNFERDFKNRFDKEIYFDNFIWDELKDFKGYDKLYGFTAIDEFSIEQV